MKKTLKFLCFALITSMCVIISSCEDPNKNNSGTLCENPNENNSETLDTWVDLGLPSGTKWKAQNEFGYYTYDEAVSQFEDALPTKVQLDELRQKCSWEWRGAGYKVTGPNGNSITLPATGYRRDSGEVCYIGSYGNYWSSTPNDSEFVWGLSFKSVGVGMNDNDRDYGHSVRLVKTQTKS